MTAVVVGAMTAVVVGTITAVVVGAIPAVVVGVISAVVVGAITAVVVAITAVVVGVITAVVGAITAVVVGVITAVVVAITAVVGGVITAVVGGVITVVVGGVIIAVVAFTAAGADVAETHKVVSSQYINKAVCHTESLRGEDGHTTGTKVASEYRQVQLVCADLFRLTAPFLLAVNACHNGQLCLKGEQQTSWLTGHLLIL